MVLILMPGVTSCSTTYRDASVNLSPEYVGKETIEWCYGNACPYFVLDDLSQCQSQARNIDFMNGNVKENTESTFSGFTDFWETIFGDK